MGGSALDVTGFTPVTSASPIWTRLDPSAQGQVLSIDLGAQGITDYGSLQQRGFCNSSNRAALELSIDGTPQPLARWPDADTNTSIRPADDAGSLQLFGEGIEPDVTGTYQATGTQDGVSSFARVGLVDGGDQYNLYRYSWVYQSNPYTAWFLTTGTSGYPGNAAPWWYSYTDDLATLSPANGAAGSPGFIDPAGIKQGMSLVGTEVSSSAFVYTGTRPARWSQATDIWIHGMLAFDWADCHQRVDLIDPTSQTITLAEPATFGIVAGQFWYAENLVEEITEPGEWWVDRSSGLLYFWPPRPLAGHEVVVSTLSAPLISITGATQVRLENLSLRSGRAEQIAVTSSAHVRLRGLILEGAGTDAIDISNGSTDVGVEYALITHPGNGGVSISAGDRPSLTPGNVYVDDSVMHDFSRWEWTYRPAVNLSGVGNRASHNLIYSAPHTAILYGGNDHLISFNDISQVCRMAADSGAIYAGRDWGARGNVIQYNYLHQLTSLLSSDVNGVYLDDCLSGITVEGNIFDQVSGLSILHGGGRDNVMTNKVFSRYHTAIGADSRCSTWLSNGTPNNTPGDSWNLLQKLEEDNYQQPPWSVAFPACAAIPDDWNTIISTDAGWLLPQGCVFSSNVGDGSGTWFSASGPEVIPAYAEIANNLADAGALFVDLDAGDLQLLPGSGARSLPGFTPIDVAAIGIEH